MVSETTEQYIICRSSACREKEHPCFECGCATCQAQREAKWWQQIHIVVEEEGSYEGLDKEGRWVCSILKKRKVLS